MFKKFLGVGNYKLLIDSIEEGHNVSVFGLNLGEKLALFSDSAFLFYVVENLEQANIVCEKFSQIGRRVGVLTESVNSFSSPFVKEKEYMKTLCDIVCGKIDTIVLTPNTLVGLMPQKNIFKNMTICKGQNIDFDKCIKELVELGYKRVDLVSEPLEFSVRGDIIDIYPVNDNPIRVFVDFDNVESLKYYNPITMLTSGDADSVSIYSCQFSLVRADDIEAFFNEHKIPKNDIYDELMDFSKVDYRRILFDQNICKCIFDMVDDGVIAFDGSKIIYDKLISEIDNYNNLLLDFSKELKGVFSDKKRQMKDILSFGNKSLVAFHYITQDNRIFKPNKVFSIRTLPSVKYYGHEELLVSDCKNYLKNGYTTILTAGGKEKGNRLITLLKSNGLNPYLFDRIGQSIGSAINVVCREYPLDILLPDEKVAIISTESLFGKKKKIIDDKVSFFDGDLPEKDDYVVHNFHGVGKCLGVETLKISDAPRDYVLIEYKNSDKLYLPVENIDQLSKYMGSDKIPTLNKIGGVEFAKTKSKVKTAVKKIAFDLISLYRERSALKGVVYPVDDVMQVDFENQFAYSETADQLKAIEDCKKDLESGKIMDRLVCGDVGYGKTEVALRIAFKTILAGKQVAILCPTTILSEQHFNTAVARMSNFGVKVEVLNRLKNPKEVQKIKDDFSNGKIDLLCGTHKLLASDIDYKNLGLLILDEEQKFGVGDKEKIKNFKKQINVLTLSATPIPRTLNMSLIGVRDISVIETPPAQRIATDVQIVEYSDELVERAICAELERGGQVLVIYNRVEFIDKFASYLKKLLPNAIVSIAHGQMEDKQLENEIYKLYTGKTQVLVATTLIENGVDLPNANTMIVVNSDKLGLSQLYQLKGRIGRSDKSSYAYFTFDSQKMLTENAYKRLGAIKEFSGMGSGFKIAMRDLEIRGAGSLLGAEQSGHIEKIGYNLYVELLNESVKELRGENVEMVSAVKIETSIPAYLSHEYVPNSTKRMAIYKEISSFNDLKQLLDYVKILEDIYGEIPKELVSLCKIGLIKNMSAKLGANKVILKDKAIICLGNKEDLTKQVLESANLYEENILINVSDTPKIEISGINKYDILDFVINYLQLIVKN